MEIFVCASPIKDFLWNLFFCEIFSLSSLLKGEIFKILTSAISAGHETERSAQSTTIIAGRSHCLTVIEVCGDEREETRALRGGWGTVISEL